MCVCAREDDNGENMENLCKRVCVNVKCFWHCVCHMTQFESEVCNNYRLKEGK